MATRIYPDNRPSRSSEKEMNLNETVYLTTRAAWRKWLQKNHKTAPEVWLRYPRVATGKPCVSYNDAVEEALCFGWIDSTRRPVDDENTAQRFSPRRSTSSYSQPNIERLRKLIHDGKVLREITEKVTDIVDRPFVFPSDIIAAIKANPDAWHNYQKFSPSYQRIRIAYIDGSRDRPDEFKKRLNNFIKVTVQNRKIGFGGIDAYY